MGFAMNSTEITIPSNRIYLDTLDPDALGSLLSTRYAYSRAKEDLYNIKYDSAFLGRKCANDTALIKGILYTKYGMVPQDYYITSLQSRTNGMIRSQKELQKVRSAEFAAREESRKKKLQSCRRRLTLCRRSKDSLVEQSRHLRDGKKPGKLYVPKDFGHRLPESKKDDRNAVYMYEVWLDGEIKRVKARIAMIEEKGRVDAEKSGRPPGRVTFGGKPFYKLKDTTDADMDKWHEQRDFARDHMILFSGRFDAGAKNWLVRYDPASGNMDITMMDGTVLHLKGVVFPYRGDELKAVLSHKKEPGWSVGYWMDFRIDHNGREYFLMKASFTVRGDGRENCYTGDGVISVDLNLDNISVSETDGEGHLLRREEIRFNLDGLTSRQADDVLGRACSRVIRRCIDTAKPLAMENIDLIKKSASLAYGNKKANRGTRMFAYRKMTAFLEGKALRSGIGVIRVNPAYTSFIGKVKYMKGMRAPVHAAASYVIGRRAMGFSEKIPAYLSSLIPEGIIRSHHWKKAARLYRLTDGIKTGAFLRELPVMKAPSDLETFKYAYM